MAPFQVLQEAEQACRTVNPSNECNDDVIAAFEDSRNMLLLFYAHQQRVSNQRDRIAGIFNDLRTENGNDPASAVVLIDYKMKFESIRYREKTEIFWQARKQLAWGGSLFCRRFWQPEPFVL